MKAKTGLVVLVIVLALAVVLVGCDNPISSSGSSDGGNRTETITEVMDSGGGVIALDDDFELEIPAGVFSGATDITVKRVNASYYNVSILSDHELLTDIIAIETDREFFRDALLIRFTPPSGVNPEDLLVGHFSDGDYTTHEPYIDDDNGDVVFPTHSLSGFGVFAGNTGKYARLETAMPLHEFIDFEDALPFFNSYDANTGIFRRRHHWGPVGYPGRGTVLFCAAMEDGQPLHDPTTYQPRMDASLLFYYDNDRRDIEYFAIEFDTLVQRDPNSQSSARGGYLTRDLMTFEVNVGGKWQSWGPNGKAARFSVHAWKDTGGWANQRIDLTDLSTRTTRIAGTSVWGNSAYSRIFFRFRFRSNKKSVADGYGAYIDNLRVIVETENDDAEDEIADDPGSGAEESEDPLDSEEGAGSGFFGSTLVLPPGEVQRFGYNDCQVEVNVGGEVFTSPISFTGQYLEGTEGTSFAVPIGYFEGLTIDRAPSDSQMEEIEDAVPSYAEVSDGSARVARLRTLRVYDADGFHLSGNNNIRRVGFENAGTTSAALHMIEWWFVDRSVVVTGEISSSGTTIIYDMNLKAGWNTVSVASQFYGGTTIRHLTRSEPTEEIVWNYLGAIP